MFNVNGMPAILIKNNRNKSAYYDDQEFDIQMKNEILSVKKYPIDIALNLLKFQELKNILIETDYMLEELGE